MPSAILVEQKNPKPIIGLFSLKPRQVLLAELNAKSAPPTMNPSAEIKSVLIQSILSFLDSNSFSKTLKRFLSEAQIQDDSWKACSFNLEEIFTKNFQTCDTKSVMLEKEVQPEVNGASAEEDVKKKKKKKNDANETNSAALKEHANNLEMDEQNKKEKDKKRRKNKSVPELNELGKEQEQPGLIPSVTEEKGKKKKNKVDKSSCEDGEKGVGKEKKDKSKDGKKKNKHVVEKCSTEDDSISKEKNSKKRKRSLSEETAETEILQESKINDPVVNVNSVKGENGHASENQLQDSSVKRQDDEEDNSDAGRSAKKQRIDSAEPKSAANAFRRVKVEEVVFTDERLQDNSYWAKDGADVGYGAKAQEVLGQVKGKGFRHEKTKKKRGSYRGGLIDLESHSVKFNYSEEE